MLKLIKPIKLSGDIRVMLNLFLPFFAIHCVEQVYYVYGIALHGYGFSSQLTGWLLGIFFLTVMAVRPFGGWALENFGIRRILIWSSFVSFIGCSMLFFKDYASLLFIGRFLMGIAFSVYTMGLFSYQAMTVSEKMRGAMFAIIASGGILPIATVGPIGEWLLINSHTGLYLAIGPILSVICWGFGRKVGQAETQVQKKEKRWGTYKDIFSSRTFVMLVVTGLMIALVDAVMSCVSIFASERGIVASYFLASLSVTAVIIRVAGAKIVNDIPRAITIAPLGMLIAGAVLLISLVPSNASFLVGGFVFGVGIGISWPIYHALVSDTLEVALRPKGTASALLLYDFGWFVTPVFVGYASPLLGIANTLLVLALFVLLALVLLQFLYWVPFNRAR
jgi:MFS family permease